MEIAGDFWALFISRGELWARFTACPHRGWMQAHAGACLTTTRRQPQECLSDVRQTPETATVRFCWL
jgi:hypothetical protein